MKREFSLSDVCIGSESKKHWVVSLPSTALALMEDVNVEDVLAANVSASGTVLISAEGVRTDNCRFT